MLKLLAAPSTAGWESPSPAHSPATVSGGITPSGCTSGRAGRRADLPALLLLVGTLLVLAHGTVSSYTVSDGSVPAHAAGGWEEISPLLLSPG